MENIRDFMDELAGGIMHNLPEDLTQDLSIIPATVTKMNDQVLYGLTFKRDKVNAAPTIYVNEEFESHLDGKPTEMISYQLTQLYLNSLMERPEVVPKDLSLEKVKDDLSFRVVEIKRNKRYLSEIPYMPLGNGLAAVCDVRVREGNDGYWSTTVTKAFMRDNQYDLGDLFTAAIEQAPKNDPPRMTSMESQMFGFPGNNYLETGRIENEDKVPMYVLSTQSGVLGAAALFYPGVQETIAENLGESYYAIPSSVHEFLIVPESLAPDRGELASLVREVNSSVLDPKDILSDNVFFYDKEEKQLTTGMQNLTLSDKHMEAK